MTKGGETTTTTYSSPPKQTPNSKGKDSVAVKPEKRSGRDVLEKKASFPASFDPHRLTDTALTPY
jgi:hypothetical protein